MSTCINEGPTFRCECNTGYDGPGTYCSDIDECQSDQCEDEQYCVNSPGSFDCACRRGYRAAEESANQMCYNINECLLGLNNCGPRQNCVDTDGSFVCECKDGYIQTPYGFCADLNECDTGDACPISYECNNLVGTYECVCSAGYEVDINARDCVDIDECNEMTCDGNRKCVNTDGSFECVCADGYREGGINCIDIDECLDGDACDENATCTNTSGSYSCQCNTGYESYGDACVGVDPC